MCGLVAAICGVLIKFRVPGALGLQVAAEAAARHSCQGRQGQRVGSQRQLLQAYAEPGLLVL